MALPITTLPLTCPPMQIQLSLVKPCKSVDKYQQVDAQGAPVTEDADIGPIYLKKSIAKGAALIMITVAVSK